MRQMKDSGIEWIGQIPEEWKVNKSSQHLSEIKNLNDDKKELNALKFTFGNIVKKNYTQIDDELLYTLSKYTKVKKNDIIINGLNLEFDFITQRVGIVCENGIITSTYLSLHPQNVIPLFAVYLLKSYDYCKVFHSLGRGLRKTLTYSDLKKIPLVIAPLNEQQRIADYLEAQCARIDETMELVRQSKEKLRAYKLSLITEAVTKGLDPDVPMKDSGLPWIGEIPAGWKIVKLKFFTSIKSGDAIRADELSETAQYEVFGGNGKIGNCVSYNCDGPSFIIGRVGAQCGNIHKTHNKIFVSDNALILKIFENKFDFIFFSLISANLGRLSTSNAQPLITATKISNTYIPVPPLPEQQRIAAYLDEKCARIDALLAEKDELLDKLAEYKKSLIFECVTGKREVAA